MELHFSLHQNLENLGVYLFFYRPQLSTQRVFSTLLLLRKGCKFNQRATVPFSKRHLKEQFLRILKNKKIRPLIRRKKICSIFEVQQKSFLNQN